MKSVALLAGVALLLLGNALASVVSAQHQPHNAQVTSRARLSGLALPHLSHLGVAWPAGAFTEDQAAATGTPTTGTPTTTTPSTSATPVTTGTPSPSPTTNPAYPDPVTILQNGFQKYSLIRTSHFQLITTGEITGQEKLNIDATGDATCSGPAFKTHVVASDTLVGTTQSRKVNANFIEIKNKAWIKKSGKNQKWKTTKTSNVGAFSFPVDNPLICPSASTGSGSGSGSGSNNSQLKDVENLGPQTFQGVKMWHIRATEVNVDSTGKTTEATLDFLFSQGSYLPYVFTVSVADPTQNLTLSQKQILTKFGEKVKVSKPKVG